MQKKQNEIIIVALVASATVTGFLASRLLSKASSLNVVVPRHRK